MASEPRRRSPCRSHVTGVAASSCARAPPAERERARALGAEWAGGYDEKPPEPLDAAVTFGRAGRVVAGALKGPRDRGGTVAINAIHLDGLPEMPYGDLWWERTHPHEASRTSLRDETPTKFLALAAAIPIRTEYE